MNIIVYTLFVVAVAAVRLEAFYGWSNETEVPHLDFGRWWGPGDKVEEDPSVREFKVQFDDKMIADLRHRIRNRRPLVPPLEGAGFSYGFNSHELDGWMNFWADEYPFRDREDFLNQYPQYKTRVQGLDIHFIWIKPQEKEKKKKKSSGAENLPLLILHGFPGSVREFYEAIPLLMTESQDRGFNLELVVPSLPGYGFSDAAVRPGLGAVETAIVLRNLMHRLEHKQFYVQGGDWGSVIGSHIATVFPKEVLGYHTNLPLALTRPGLVTWLLGALHPPLVVDPALESRLYPLTKVINFFIREFGYFHIQATKPDTIGVALSDSPSGLLAYILQLMSGGTRANYTFSQYSGLDRHFTREQLVDNLMIYWTSNSITTAGRLYAETVNAKSVAGAINQIPTPVPTWSLHAKHEIWYQSPMLLRYKYPNLVHSTVLPSGGHFLALELPHVFAQDVAAALAAFRRLQDKD